jgi:hypothetical protein
MAKWEADKYSKHFSYRLKGMTWTQRHAPMTRVKLLPTRFYQLNSGSAPTGVCLKLFGHRENNGFLWCAGTTAQVWENLFRNPSRWRHQPKAHWKVEGMVMGWTVGRCQHRQDSERCSIEECEQVVGNILAATGVRKFQQK